VTKGDIRDENLILEDRKEHNLRERELKVEDTRHQALSIVIKEHKEFRDYQRKLKEQALNGCLFYSLEDPEYSRAHSAVTCQRALGTNRAVREAYQLAGSIERFLQRREVTQEFSYYLSYFTPQEVYNAQEENKTEGG
jgi:hypothetical protein